MVGDVSGGWMKTSQLVFAVTHSPNVTRSHRSFYLGGTNKPTRIFGAPGIWFRTPGGGGAATVLWHAQVPNPTSMSDMHPVLLSSSSPATPGRSDVGPEACWVFWSHFGVSETHAYRTVLSVRPRRDPHRACLRRTDATLRDNSRSYSHDPTDVHGRQTRHNRRGPSCAPKPGASRLVAHAAEPITCAAGQVPM